MLGYPGGAIVNVCAAADTNTLKRPCVDCGLVTGCFCDGDEFGPSGQVCYAVVRSPKEKWAPFQRTPLCTECDRKRGRCHFCRGLEWCSPEAHEKEPVQEPLYNVPVSKVVIPDEVASQFKEDAEGPNEEIDGELLPEVVSRKEQLSGEDSDSEEEPPGLVDDSSDEE